MQNHVFIANRCIHCGSNDLDVYLYEPDNTKHGADNWCIKRETTTFYSTSTHQGIETNIDLEQLG